MEQKQTEVTTSTKKSIGVVNVAVITLLMGASLVIAAGIVLGLADMKKMPQKNPQAVMITESDVMFLEAEHLIKNIQTSGDQETELSEIKVASSFKITPSTTREELLLKTAQFLRNMGVPEQEITAKLNDESKLVELSPIFAPENEDQSLYEVFQEIDTTTDDSQDVLNADSVNSDWVLAETSTEDGLTQAQRDALGEVLDHMQNDGSAFWSWARQEALRYASGGVLIALNDITNLDIESYLNSLENSQLGQFYGGVRGWLQDRHFEFQCSLNGGASFQYTVGGACINFNYDSKTDGGTIGVEGSIRW
ncbi:MAG: hypothetical protein WCW66_06555 [Patescibacteria group bacterium]